MHLVAGVALYKQDGRSLRSSDHLKAAAINVTNTIVTNTWSMRAFRLTIPATSPSAYLEARIDQVFVTINTKNVEYTLRHDFMMIVTKASLTPFQTRHIVELTGERSSFG